MSKIRVFLAIGVMVVGCGSLLAQAPVADSQPQNVLKIKTKSNIKNDRVVAPPAGTPGTANPRLTPAEAAKIKSHSNQANNRAAQTGTAAGVAPGTGIVDAAKIKSHSNQTNNRAAQPAPATGAVTGASESATPH